MACAFEAAATHQARGEGWGSSGLGETTRSAAQPHEVDVPAHDELTVLDLSHAATVRGAAVHVKP